MKDRRSFLAVSGALALSGMSMGASAQSQYPERPIRIIVPLPAGSPVDVIGRRLAHLISSDLGVAIVVDNKPGASSTLGAAEVSRAKADGYTLLLTVAEPLVSSVAVMKIPYLPERDFKFISKVSVATSGPVLLASNMVKSNNLLELIKEAKSAPKPMTYGSFGAGSYPQLILETLARQTGIEFSEVPYKGSPPALMDVVAGQIALTFSSVDQAGPFLENGRVKAIAIMDKAVSLPDVKTFADAGFSSFVFRNKPWIGLLGPSALSDVIVQRLVSAVKRATNDAGFRKFLGDINWDPVGSTPNQFLEDYRAEMAVIPGLIRGLGITPQ